MERKGFLGLKQKRTEMLCYRDSRGLPLHVQKAMEKSREVEKHLEQAAVLGSKPQETFHASHSHHPLATTALSQGLEATMACSQRALKINSLCWGLTTGFSSPIWN